MAMGNAGNEPARSDKSTPDAPSPSLLSLGNTSPGVERMKLVSAQMTRWDRLVLFVSIFLVAFAYSLDSAVRNAALTPTATSDFLQHSLIGTINVVMSVTGAAAQPVIAKIADVFGRLELVFLSVVLYCGGTLIQASAHNVEVYCIGALIWNLGFITIVLLAEVIIADVTSLRSRVLFSYIPTLPFLFNTWLSGDVALASVVNLKWRWSVRMWAIIYPACSLPLIIILWLSQRRAIKGASPDITHWRSPLQNMGWRGLLASLFWQLDILGMVLLALALGLTLTPLTLAKGVFFDWSDPCILVPLTLGVLCVPTFIFWETCSLYPMIPFWLLRDRAVWGSLGVALTFNMAFCVQSEYFYTVLRIAYGCTSKSATRIVNLYSFTSVLTGALVGLAVYRVRYTRPFIIVGTVLYIMAFVLLVLFNGGKSSEAPYGLVASQVLLGIAGGLFPYTTMASIQAATKHEHLAVITGVYLAMYRTGAAFGSCIAASIWNYVLPKELYAVVPDYTASYVFSAPIQFLDGTTFYAAMEGVKPMGADMDLHDLEMIGEAHKRVQRWLCIVAAGTAIPLIIFAFVIRNPRFGDEQSLSVVAPPRSHQVQPPMVGLNGSTNPPKARMAPAISKPPAALQNGRSNPARPRYVMIVPHTIPEMPSEGTD